MAWYWWIAIVIGAFVAYQIISTILGALMSMETSGRFYLSAKLKKMGVRHLFSDQCVYELASLSARTAEMMARVEGKSKMTAKTEMVSAIDSQAMLIRLWLQGDNEAKKFKAIPETMTKYGIPFGGGKPG